MPRTTLDLDSSVLNELRRLSRERGKSIGRVASEILAAALKQDRTPRPKSLRWASKPMGAKVDLEDKEAVRRLLDRD